MDLPEPNRGGLASRLEAATRAREHTHAVAHRASSTGMRWTYLGAVREVPERPVGRCAGPVLSPMRISAHLGASWTREARVFIGQSSETPGALELGMRRSSGGLRDGVARVDVSIHRVDGGMWRVLPCAAHELVACRRSFATRTRECRARPVIGTVRYYRLQQSYSTTQ